MLIKSALVARGSLILCEYDASTGNDDLNEISRKVLGKIPRTGAVRSYVYGGHTFNYVIDRDHIFLCIGGFTTGSEVIFKFLDDFRHNFHRFSRQVSGPDRVAELTRMLRDLLNQYNNTDRGLTTVQSLEQDLESVTSIMRDNVGKIMERGEAITSLIDKTSILRTESSSFRAETRRYNETNRWHDSRTRLMILFSLIVGFFIFISRYGR